MQSPRLPHARHSTPFCCQPVRRSVSVRDGHCCVGADEEADHLAASAAWGPNEIISMSWVKLRLSSRARTVRSAEHSSFGGFQRLAQRRAQNGSRIWSTRSARWAIATVSLAALAAAGWRLGLAATDRPDASLGDVRDRVQVWVSDPEATLTLEWWTSPWGTVDVVAWLGHPESDEASLIVLLTCNARLREYEDLSYRARFDIDEIAGEPEACDQGQVDYRRAPLQIITFTFPAHVEGGGSGRAQVRGTTVSPWTDEAAGERLADAPAVYVGGRSLNAAFDETAYREPRAASISTKLLGREFEALEAFFPTEIARGLGATGKVTATENRGSEQSGPTAVWHSAWSAEEMRSRGWRIPYYNHTSASAHWSNPAGVARAQQWLLLSGVFLGVVGSVLVEGLFSWARHRSDRSATSGRSGGGLGSSRPPPRRALSKRSFRPSGHH